MRNLIAVLALAVFAVGAYASYPYTLGADGYYYGADGAKYVRSVTKVWVPGYYYYSGCCRYWKPGYWKDSYSYTKVPYASVLTASDPNWRAKLLDIAAYRDKAEAKLRASNNEHNQFIESVRELGLSGNFYWQNYGLAPDLVAYSNPHVGAYGASGNTLYTHSTYRNSSVADVYGALDPNIFLQQAAAFNKDALSVASQGHSLTAQFAEKQSERDLRVAEIIAKAAAASQVLQAAEAAPRASVTKQETHTTSTPLGTKGGRWIAAAQRCVQCHGDTDPQGGYRVSQHWQMDPEKQMAVVKRLVADQNDPGFMPRRPNGAPGERLPADLIMEFLPADKASALSR